MLIELEKIRKNDTVYELISTHIYWKLKLSIDPKGFSNRLSNACDHFGLPPKHKGRVQALAELMGVTTMTVSYWFDGKFIPARKKREKLAQLLKVSLSYLEIGSGEISDTSNDVLISRVKVPVVETDNYIYGSEKKANSSIYVDMQKTYEDMFAIIVPDESMSPIFNKGGLAIISPNEEIRTNAIVAIHLKSENKILLRQYFYMPQKQFLSPIDKDYQVYEVGESVEIIGHIVYYCE